MNQSERQDTIRAELERRARAGKTINYGEMAELVGLAAVGLTPYLDVNKAQEAEQNRPDLGCLAVNSLTGFPGYIGKSESERANALRIREQVFDAWRCAPLRLR